MFTVEERQFLIQLLSTMQIPAGAQDSVETCKLTHSILKKLSVNNQTLTRQPGGNHGEEIGANLGGDTVLR